MELVHTTRGEMPASELDRVVSFEEREREFVIAVEYRVKGDPPMPIADDTLLAKLGRADAREIVRRDCHVVLKAPSVTAQTEAGSFT